MGYIAGRTAETYWTVCLVAYGCPHSGLSFPVEICLLLLDIHSGLYETIMT